MLQDLQKLGAQLQHTYLSTYQGRDEQLPLAFKQMVKEIDGGSIVYNDYSFIVTINQSAQKIFFPNQLWYIAACFADYYKALSEYTKIVKADLHLTDTEIKQAKDNQNFAETLLANTTLADEEKSLVIKFLSDYAWWYGGKGIERADFYMSPILGLCKLVNASQGYVADLCKFLAKNDEALQLLKNEISDPVTIKTSSSLPLQQIFYGAPGTGKSHETNETTRKYPDTIRTTFHPDSDYSTFVGAYKPTTTREFVYGLNGGNTIAFIDPNTNKPLETSKIEYKFVKQAFLKAYIRAWQKMGAADVTTNPLQPSATPAKSLTFTKDPAIFTILTMDDSRVSFKKEEPFGKSPVENTWHKLWLSGSFEIPNVPRSGATFQEAVSQWICEWKGADTTENDFEKGWNEIISRLKAGQQIEVQNNNGNKVYYLSYNGNEDSVKKTSEDKATKNAIKNAYDGDTSQNASAKGIAEILHSYSSDFKKAWEQLKAVVLNGGQQTTNPTETIAIQPQFLIIEEINRGNCAQIFGDIFQLLDRTDNGYSQYPIEADEDIQKALLDPAPADGLSFGPNGLQLSDAIKQQLKALNDNCPDEIVSKVCCGQLLVLPPNLHIWATMNTSDQSLFPIDSAFKRRWDWQYKPIQDAGKNWKILVENSQYDWWQFIDAINQQINITTSSEDKKLGYFFCKPCEGTTIKADKVVNKVIFYLWNDVFKDYDLPAAFNYGDSKKKPDGSTSEHMSFNDFYTDQAVCIHQLMQNLKVIDENATATPAATPETASDTTTTEVE